MELLEGNESRCQNMFWMNKDVFIRLCDELENIYKVKGSQRISVAEKLGMFLYTLGEGAGNRNVQERFQHFGKTVSRYFSGMLNVVCDMTKEFIKPSDPKFKSIPPEILGDYRYMPHFKDCIGAIDGVHVRATISPSNQVPYIGRKGIPTHNIMAVCNFDMQFTFACAGWEGTAHDTRIFQSAIHNLALKFPKPPNEYPQMKWYLGPYKCQRYHLPEFRRGAQPTGYKEIFNHAHSSIRSVIERTFGV
ncbi:putative nuclease HARBI1 [Rosa chinensis]|uniref:putative nuclease HARBI1 n=1 Tax=Rosa chinensis TaxID=74649 RepID=UPI000D08EE3D|nr:putative nuclease HARBI1 [Rosa chinensis]XP_040370187.1 putative nuclease HARBI1 [Rosa chinensis]